MRDVDAVSQPPFAGQGPSDDEGHPAETDRGFAKLIYQLDDYPGAFKTAIFGIQHVLVMFTAMVGGPLIVARLLNLPEEARVVMITGTMIGCGIATLISSLGLGFIGPRLPIVMGVFYLFIGPLVAIAKSTSLAAAMTALIIGGLVQFAWSPLISKARRLFPHVVTGTTILLIGIGLMKAGIATATGLNTPDFGKPTTLALAAMIIVLILVITRFTRGMARALSLFIAMLIGYAVSWSLGLLNLKAVSNAEWVALPHVMPFGGFAWPGIFGIVAVLVCFLATAVETTGHTLAMCRVAGIPAKEWRIRGAVANDGLGSAISVLFGGLPLTSYSQNIGVISLTGIGSRFVVAAGGAFLVIMALVPKVSAIVALMPNAVLGGVLLFMFGMVASVGIDLIGSNLKTRRDAVIVAASLGVGIGIQMAPNGAFDAIPPAIRILVGDGVVMGILTSVVLNLFFPKEQE
jgi:NCS2 family nucleobase:cation symporter-2